MAIANMGLSGSMASLVKKTTIYLVYLGWVQLDSFLVLAGHPYESAVSDRSSKCFYFWDMAGYWLGQWNQWSLCILSSINAAWTYSCGYLKDPREERKAFKASRLEFRTGVQLLLP